MGTYNPYAAPQAASAFGPTVPIAGAPQPWGLGEVLRGGWEAYKANWPGLTLGYFVITLVGGIPGQVAPLLGGLGVVDPKSTTYYAIHVPLSIFGWLIAEFFAAGCTKAALNATRTGRATFGDFFSAGGRFLPFVIMSLLRGLAIVFSSLLLFIPGIIVALGFANAPFYVVDQNMGPIEALRASWRSSDGQKWDLFVLAFVGGLITFAGLLCVCLGFFVAVPMLLITSGIVYTRMSGTAAATEAPPGAYGPSAYGAPGAYGAWGPPGGADPGWGPPGGGYGGPPA